MIVVTSLCLYNTACICYNTDHVIFCVTWRSLTALAGKSVSAAKCCNGNGLSCVMLLLFFNPMNNLTQSSWCTADLCNTGCIVPSGCFHTQQLLIAYITSKKALLTHRQHMILHLLCKAVLLEHATAAAILHAFELSGADSRPASTLVCPVLTPNKLCYPCSC